MTETVSLPTKRLGTTELIESPMPSKHAENFALAIERKTENWQDIASEMLCNLEHKQQVTSDAIKESTAKLIQQLQEHGASQGTA
jgi:hypothetical protein